MLQVVQPDCKVDILIRDGKVIGMQWGEILNYEPNLTVKQLKKRLIKYLRQAMKISDRV